MKDFDPQWRRLTALARQAPAGGDEAAPYGFATRVAARAAEARRASGSFVLFEKFALRGLIAAFAFTVASVAYSYTSTLTGESESEIGLVSDPVAELLDLSS